MHFLFLNWTSFNLIKMTIFLDTEHWYRSSYCADVRMRGAIYAVAHTPYYVTTKHRDILTCFTFIAVYWL
jgi:hypothetical protein